VATAGDGGRGSNAVDVSGECDLSRLLGEEVALECGRGGAGESVSFVGIPEAEESVWVNVLPLPGVAPEGAEPTVVFSESAGGLPGEEFSLGGGEAEVSGGGGVMYMQSLLGPVWKGG
jgi:hypothetical protein